MPSNEMSDGNLKKTMTDKNTNTEIRKEFCPNCEAETPCTHEAELFVCDICGEDFAKYIVSRQSANSDVSMTQDVLTDIKTPQSIENTNPDYYKQELARRDASLLTEGEQKEILSYIQGNYDRDKIPTWLLDLIDGITRRDEIIARLKEDAERLADNYIAAKRMICACFVADYQDDEIITLHHALMKELEC